MESKNSPRVKMSELIKLFEQRYGNLSCGGLLNPETESLDENLVLVKCHYDGFEGENDEWAYLFDTRTKQFTAA